MRTIASFLRRTSAIAEIGGIEAIEPHHRRYRRAATHPPDIPGDGSRVISRASVAFEVVGRSRGVEAIRKAGTEIGECERGSGRVLGLELDSAVNCAGAQHAGRGSGQPTSTWEVPPGA